MRYLILLCHADGLGQVDAAAAAHAFFTDNHGVGIYEMPIRQAMEFPSALGRLAARFKPPRTKTETRKPPNKQAPTSIK
jgi:hypothetical protein